MTTRFYWISFLIILILLLTVPVFAGITYIPGMDRVSALKTLNLNPSLSVPTWELFGGLLLADRLSPPGATRFGPAFQPVYPESDWFIVKNPSDTRAVISKTNGIPDPANFGTVHLRDAEFIIVEIPDENLPEFTTQNFDFQRIPQDTPPAGSDTYASMVRRAVTSGLRRDEPLDRLSIPQFLSHGDEVTMLQVLQEISGAVPFTYQGTPRTVSTRYYNTSGKTLVADYLADKMAGFGYTVTFQPFTVGSTSCRNVIATKIGTVYPDEYVIVGGHYDSTSSQPQTLAPGCDDNGSGTSLVVEIARMAATYDFERSIQFVLFDSEEQGLNGSYHFVDEAVGAGQTIIAAITADMVTYYSSHFGVIIEGESPWEWLMSIMESQTATYTTLTSRKDYSSWGSDHVPFQQAGIPAFLAIEWDWDDYPYYHSTQDNWSHVQATSHIGFEISQACAATLAEVAGLVSCFHHGDVDFNGSLTAADAQTAFAISLGAWTPTFQEHCAADCNGDESVTAGDAQSIFIGVLGMGSCVDPV